MIRRALLAALLVYVSLDLSLPEMPGAFVFDPAGSVETIDGGRTRQPDGIVVLPAPGVDSSSALSQPFDGNVHRLTRGGGRRHAALLVIRCRPRAACSTPSSPEDPH